MIDLFTVKLNGQYDEIGATPTISNGTFLCDTSGTLQRGYSYQINGTNITRIEAQKDYKIQKSIYPSIQNICEWLNNWFVIKYDYRNNFAYGEYGLSGSFHEVPQVPQTGDLCKIRTTDNWDLLSLYNIYFVSYVTVGENGINADNPLYKSGDTYFYYIMHLPQDVEDAISRIIHYDIFTRGEVSDLKSESIGSYSYTKEDVHIGSLSYPSELIGGIEAVYKKLRFVQ